nr:MAG TPA: tail assembly chaperone protein [Caudoviricetes sp.]
MAKNITLDMLIARKEQSNNDKMKVVLFNSEVLGGTIEVRKLKARDVIKIMDSTDNKSTEEAYNANCKLIYKHCPILQDKELQAAYEVAEPYEVVVPVFEENLGEINKLSNFILSLYGLTDSEQFSKAVEEEADDIKN